MLFAPLKNQRKCATLTGVWAGPGEDVIGLHGPDGRFVKLSDGAIDIFGLRPEELTGRRLMSVIAPGHQDRLLAALDAVADPKGSGRALFEARVRVGERLGPTVEMALSRAAGGGLRSVTRNIEQRLAREQALAAETRALAADTARRNDHLNNVSHEIRTPLNAVIGFADAIHGERFGPIGNDRYRDYARVIHESGQHLLSLIGDLLDLSRAEANETNLSLSDEDPRAIVNLCTDIMRLRASEAGLSLDLVVEPGVEPCRLDAKIVRQIVLNLLSNALKFTEAGGITVTLRREGPWLSISVIDTGVGMSPDELALVGQRYAQARSEGVRGARGSGIGLALSKALARVHGGDLRLQSETGVGTTATFRLPFSPVETTGVTSGLSSSNVHRLDLPRRA